MANKANYWANVNLSGVQNGGASLRVVIAGVEVPVSQFTMTYELNSIPQAAALVAMGRNVYTNKLSPIYELSGEIKQMAPVTVYLTGALGDYVAAGANGKPLQFPRGDHVIFTGYVGGLSYRRSNGRVALVINMVNRLADLAMSSGGSKDVVPGTPADFMLSTLATGPGAENVGSADTKFVDTLPDDLKTDFSKGILNAFYYVSQENRLQTHESESTCLPSGPISKREENKQAAKVIEGSGDWLGIANYVEGVAAKYVEKYPLIAHSSGYEKIAKYVGDQMAASMASTSMWGMLLGTVLDDFGCGIIPLAQTAILAPILPIARIYAMTIYPDEYTDFDMSMQSKRPLYGVGVIGNYQMGTVNNSTPKLCTGAAFVAKANNNQPFNDGMWMFVNAPQWMDDWMNYDPSSLTGDADINVLLGQVSHDNVGVGDAKVDRDPGQEIDDWNKVMYRYAQSVYASNALRGRDGTITGKLRFDIAPGTTIMIKNQGELISGGVDKLSQSLCGFVNSVTVMINAEQSSAVTTLGVTNLRSVRENDNDRFSLERHPFFGGAYFTYAPLVPGLSLPPRK